MVRANAAVDKQDGSAVAKKRGRPRKVLAEVQEEEQVEAQDEGEKVAPKKAVRKPRARKVAEAKENLKVEVAEPVKKPTKARKPRKQAAKQQVSEDEKEEGDEDVEATSDHSDKEASTQENVKAILSPIAKIFDECQHSYAVHKKSVILLRKIQREDPNQFLKEFVEYVNRVLVVYKRETTVERTIDFIVAFCSADGNGNSKTDKIPTTRNQAVPEEEIMADSNFTLFLIGYLVELVSCKDKAIRFRVAQLISGLLNSLGEEADLSDELFGAIQDGMVALSMDKIPTVRAQAVSAMCRLQNPTDEEDVVLKRFVEMLRTDPSKDVRKAVLTNIGISKITLPFILERLRDVREDVRKRMVEVVKSKVDLRALSIEHRNFILSHGLKDRSDAIRESTTELLVDKWLSFKQFDIIALLSALDVEEHESTVETALKCLLKKVSDEVLDTVQIFKAEEGSDEDSKKVLTAESAFYWRVACETLRSKTNVSRQDRVDALLPSITQLCELLSHYKSVQEPFIVRQLLLLGRSMDLALDEMGRRHLALFLRDLLLDVSSAADTDTIVAAEQLLRFAHADENEHTRVMLEIISELYEPLDKTQNKHQPSDDEESDETDATVEESVFDKKVKVAAKVEQLQEQLESLESVKTAFVRQEEFEKAAGIKREISSITQHIKTLEEEYNQLEDSEEMSWLRVCGLVVALFQHTRKDLRDPCLCDLLPHVIVPALQHTNPVIRQEGVRSLGLYCLLDEAVCKNHLILFKQIIANDEEPIQLTALRAIFDFLMVFEGLLQKPTPVDSTHIESAANGDNDDDDAPKEPTSAEDEEALPGVELVSILTQFLNHANSDFRTCAVEGFSKLLFVGRLSNVSILSQLVLLHFHPATEEDHRLRQCLAAFFPTYVFLSAANRSLLEQSVIPCLRTLLYATTDSPLKSISIERVAEMLVYLTSPAFAERFQEDGSEVKSTSSSHERLALAFCYDILANPQGLESKTYPKLLNLLSIREEEQDVVKTLRVLLEQIMQVVKDKTNLKYLQKFAGNMEALDRCPQEPLSDDLMQILTETAQKKRDELNAFLNADEPDSDDLIERGRKKAAAKNVKKTKQTKTTSVGAGAVVASAVKSARKLKGKAQKWEGSSEESDSSVDSDSDDEDFE